ncbi:MAG: hypothetical protein D6763_01895 [Alphaproteobacteria bacterium]|nr:MAG: hypothetical protein D6763_01895 [Alphaproteobacteria bacterium]
MVALAASRLLLMHRHGAPAPGNGKLLTVFVGVLVALGLVAVTPLIGQFALGALFLLGAGGSLLALYRLARGSGA